MPTPKILDESLLVKMYEKGKGIREIESHFGISNQVVYSRLQANGIKSNRKVSTSWTEREIDNLIKWRESGLVGEELFEKIPNRTKYAIKSQLNKLRNRRLID